LETSPSASCWMICLFIRAGECGQSPAWKLDRRRLPACWRMFECRRMRAESRLETSGRCGHRARRCRQCRRMRAESRLETERLDSLNESLLELVQENAGRVPLGNEVGAAGGVSGAGRVQENAGRVPLGNAAWPGTTQCDCRECRRMRAESRLETGQQSAGACRLA